MEIGISDDRTSAKLGRIRAWDIVERLMFLVEETVCKIGNSDEMNEKMKINKLRN